jgi:hypothetical protein
MATVKGTNKTLIDLGGSGTSVIPRGEYAGTVKCMYDDVTFASNGTADIGKIATPPPGSMIVGMTVVFPKYTGGVTFDIGDSDDVDRYFDALDVGTALGTSSAILTAGMAYVIGTADGDDDIYITIAGSSVSGTTKTCIFYV